MSDTRNPPGKARRPHRVTFLAVIALLLAAWNGIRLGEAITFWQTLREYGARPGPLYILISSGVWVVAGLILTGGIWLGKTWAWYAAIGSAACYPAWIWFDRLVFQQPHANLPFALGVTLASLCMVLAILFTRKSISFFQIQRKSNEP